MDLTTLQKVALSVTNERSADTVLKRIVTGLSQDKKIALARIWLIDKGDSCETCPALNECTNKNECLHLIASDGVSILHNKNDYTKTDGHHRRIPLGIRKVGTIAKTGEPTLFKNINHKTPWLQNPNWAMQEQIMSFAGQPLIFHGKTLGVLAIFSRQTLLDSSLSMLRSFADNAASSIANARAFEEINNLRQRLELENQQLRQEAMQNKQSGDIIGNNPALLKILDQIEMVSPTDANVLIQGESGVGKELIANAIHAKSKRKEKEFVKVNCASIPKELFESELFGHIKGAFTGAIKDRGGKFQLADKGTIFLDEISEIPIELQGKLLRTIQEGEMNRLGEDKTRKVDVRIIAATNQNLKEQVNKKLFREDLYYRLSVFPIEAPALRERLSDMPALAELFIQKAAIKFGLPTPKASQAQINKLKKYNWPGNIRELQNIIERAVILCKGSQLQFDIPEVDGEKPETIRREPITSVNSYSELKDLEKKLIYNTLIKTNGKVFGPRGAAELLELKPTTLASKINSLGLRKKNDFNYNLP